MEYFICINCYSYRKNLNELKAVFVHEWVIKEIQQHFRYLWMETKYCIRLITTPVLPLFFVLSTETERDWSFVTSRSTEALNFVYSNLYIHRHIAYGNKHFLSRNVNESLRFCRKKFVCKEKELFVLSFKMVTLHSVLILSHTTHKTLTHGNDWIYWRSVLVFTSSVNLWNIRQRT